ncbi:hypothetical protein ACROYT_G043305 [Oculina patagonica]
MFEEKTPNALKADRVRHRVTFNPNKASPEEILRVAVPMLEEGVVVVPGSLALVFNLTVSGHANNVLVNNVTRVLVSRIVVKFVGETLQDTNAYDVYKLFEDLCLPVEKRGNMFLEDIEALQKELKNDYVINNELSNLVGGLSFNYAPTSAALITAKHVDYDSA